MKQKYTSANTSINSKRLPAIYGNLNLKETGMTIDYGCGKFFDSYHLPETVKGYDPFNRPDEAVLGYHYNSAICSNVLNVIMEEDVREEVLTTLANLADTVYITVYEGTGSGVGAVTKKDCYQLNRKKREYLPELKKVFSSVTQNRGMFICHN